MYKWKKKGAYGVPIFEWVYKVFLLDPFSENPSIPLPSKSSGMPICEVCKISSRLLFVESMMLNYESTVC